MDKLSSILGSRNYDEPPETRIIREYVSTEFNSVVSVTVRDKDIIINAPSSALATTLRLRGPQLKKLLDTDKRLVFHSL